jgi:hypothetical protein
MYNIKFLTMSSYASLIAVAPRTNSKGTAVDSGFKAVI